MKLIDSDVHVVQFAQSLALMTSLHIARKRMSDTLVHLRKPLDGMRCHLAGTLVWSKVTLCYNVNHKKGTLFMFAIT